MSDPNDQRPSQHGGYSLGGSGPAEPLPAEWSRTGGNRGTDAGGGGQRNVFASTNRLGRIGAWGSAAQSSNPSSRSAGGFATLRDIAGSSGHSVGGSAGGLGMGGTGGDDGDEDSQEVGENEAGENWYAGGERSGISIENPDRRSGNNIVRDILRKAAEAGSAPLPPSRSSGPFSGSAYTLGSDEVDSTYIPDPNAPKGGSDEQEVATRHITFWRDGFSVEDGPLMRYDEPANSQLLDEINAGHAPPQILNVRVGQPVELRVTRRLNDNYVPPPVGPIGIFEGQGHRLGATVPAVTAGNPERNLVQTQFEVDQSLPTTSVQVRLADGTRLIARMNLHHTVGDIRNFINASRPGSSTTPYTIQTTFPNRILEDVTQTIEQAELKNSVVVQKLI